MEAKKTWSLTGVFTAVFFILLFILAIVGMQKGVFRSKESLKEFIVGFGLFGSFVFISFQAVQVVLPLLPGSLACVVGVMAFGPVRGFFYNYIGICIGCVAAFFLARRYGTPFVKKVTKAEQYEKYSAWLNKGKRFEFLFATAVLLPGAPDDLLCFLAGLTKMTFRKFLAIILLGKPLALFLYSMALTTGVELLWKLAG